MNLCLFSADDLVSSSTARLSGARFKHVIDVLKCTEGDSFTAGMVDGLAGRATILELNADHLLCELNLHSAPPPKLPLTLILALPRPKMLRRTLRTIAELGVERLILLNTWKVEKSYWQTPFLQPDAIAEQLRLGLEQAKDTVMPEVIIAKRFKPFVEDDLPALVKDKRKLIAHPNSSLGCPLAINTNLALAIGPEGGFTDYEVDMMCKADFETFQLGQRIYRVENAVTICISKLYN